MVFGYDVAASMLKLACEHAPPIVRFVNDLPAGASAG
jgi:hypothetical protein